MGDNIIGVSFKEKKDSMETKEKVLAFSLLIVGLGCGVFIVDYYLYKKRPYKFVLFVGGIISLTLLVVSILFLNKNFYLGKLSNTPITTAPVTTAPVTTAPTLAPVTAAPVTTLAPVTAEPTLAPNALLKWVSYDNIQSKMHCIAEDNNNTFIAVRHGLNPIIKSSDGVTWDIVESVLYGYWKSITWSKDLDIFCAVGSGTMAEGLVSANNVIISKDKGETWLVQTTPFGVELTSVVWSSEVGRFVAFGIDVCVWSSDGIIWTSSNELPKSNYTLPPYGNTIVWRSVTWSPKLRLFCAVSANGSARLITSPYGINWTKIQTTGLFTSVTWSPKLELFCAVGTKVITSSNGIDWSDLEAPPADKDRWWDNTDQWSSVAWSPDFNLFVAVSTDNLIMVSPTGRDWKLQIPPKINSWTIVIWSSILNKFVAGGRENNFMIGELA